VAPAPVADPVDTYMPGVPQGAEQVAAEAGIAAAPQVEVQPEPQQVAGTGPQVIFGPRAEMVQQVPASKPSAVPARKPAVAAPARVALAPVVRQPKAGNYYVQLGAYENAAVARDGWARYARKVPALATTTPQGMNFSTAAGKFYRLSVGGFARPDAVELCQQVRAKGGACFVRAQAGDTVASWSRPRGAQLAAR
jgi:hypothetical protein